MSQIFIVYLPVKLIENGKISLFWRMRDARLGEILVFNFLKIFGFKGALNAKNHNKYPNFITLSNFQTDWIFI